MHNVHVLGLLYGDKLWITLKNVRNVHDIITALEAVVHRFHFQVAE